MRRARHDLQVRQQRRGVGGRAALARAAAVHVDGLAVQVARRGHVAVGGGERAGELVVIELIPAVEDRAVDARGGQPDVGLAARRAADAGGVGAQHVAEEHLLQLRGGDGRLGGLRRDDDRFARRGGGEDRARLRQIEVERGALGDDGPRFDVVARVRHLAAELLVQRLQVAGIGGQHRVGQRYRARAEGARGGVEQARAQRALVHAASVARLGQLEHAPVLDLPSEVAGRERAGRRQLPRGIHRPAADRLRPELRAAAERRAQQRPAVEQRIAAAADGIGLVRDRVGVKGDAELPVAEIGGLAAVLQLHTDAVVREQRVQLGGDGGAHLGARHAAHVQLADEGVRHDRAARGGGITEAAAGDGERGEQADGDQPPPSAGARLRRRGRVRLLHGRRRSLGRLHRQLGLLRDLFGIDIFSGHSEVLPKKLCRPSDPGSRTAYM